MKLEKLVIKYKWWFIIVPVVLTLLAAIPLLNTKVNANLEEYLPENSPATNHYNQIKDLFGDPDPVILIFHTDDLLNPVTLKRVKSLSKAFHRSKDFKDVISLFDIKDIKGDEGAMIVDPIVKRIPKTKEQVEALRKKIMNNKFVYKSIVSDDFKYMALVLKVKPGIEDEELISTINRTLKKYPGDEKVYKAGYAYLRTQINSDISRDMMVLMPIGLLLMIIFLSVSFREAKAVMAPLIVVAMSIIISMGFFPLMGWDLSIITILAPVMMIAIANNYGVHFVARYQELRVYNPGWSVEQITKDALKYLKNPIVITGLTTIAGVLGLVTHILRPARQLGVASALGIAFALIFSLTFIPVFFAVQKEKKKFRRAKTMSGGNAVLRPLIFFGKKITRYPVTVLVIFGIILLIAGSGIYFLHSDSNSENFLPKKHPFRQATTIVNEKFGGTKNISVLFEGNMKDPAILNRLDHYEKELKKMPEVGSVVSLATIIHEMSKALNNPGDPYYDTIPPTEAAVAQYLELYSMSGDPEDFEDYVNFNYDKAIMNVQFRADSKFAVEDVANRIEQLTKSDPDFRIMGGYCLIDKEMADSIIRGQIYSLIFAIIAIAILLVLIFRSVVAGILGSLPLIYTIVTLFGTMGWLDIKLDIATAMLSSIAIGVGVDYTIHFFWRYKHEMLQGKTPREAVMNTLTSTGRGITINALSVVLGFSVLFISSFLTIKYFAYLIIFSIIVCLFGALVLIPAISILFRPKFLEKKENTKHKKQLKNEKDKVDVRPVDAGRVYAD